VGPLVHHGELSSAIATTPLPSSPSPPPPSGSFAAAAGASAGADGFQHHTSTSAPFNSTGSRAGVEGEGGASKPVVRVQRGEGILREVEVLPLVADAAGGLDGEGSLDEEEELRSMVRMCAQGIVCVCISLYVNIAVF